MGKSPAYLDILHVTEDGNGIPDRVRDSDVREIRENDLDELLEHDADCIVSDLYLDDTTAAEILTKIRDSKPDLPFIVKSREGINEDVVDILNHDATRYVSLSGNEDTEEKVGDAVEDLMASHPRDAYLAEAVTDPFFLVRSEGGGFKIEGTNTKIKSLAGVNGKVEGDDVDILFERPGEIEKHLRECRDTDQPVGFEYDAVSGGEEKIMEVKLQPMGSGKISGVMRDVTKRVERKQSLEETKRQLDMVLDGGEVGIWGWNLVENEVTFNDRLYEVLNLDKENLDLDLEVWWKLVHPNHVDGLKERLEEHFRGEIDQYKFELKMRTGDDGWKWIRTLGKIVETDSDGNPTRAAGIHLDIDERKRYEIALEKLHLSTNELFLKRDKQEVVDILADTLAEALELPIVIYLYNEDEGRLEPRGEYRAKEIIEESVTVGPGDGIAWTVFASHKSRVCDEYGKLSHLQENETEVEGEVLVPVGEQGLISVYSEEPEDFTDREIRFIELMSIYADSALANIDRESELREKKERLENQADQLKKLDYLNVVARDIHRAILEADTREEMERSVQNKLNNLDEMGLARIVEVDLSTLGEDGEGKADFTVKYGEKVPGYFHEFDDGLPSGEPTVRAAKSDEIFGVTEDDTPHLEKWRKKAFAYDYPRAIAIPLSHKGWRYSVLSIYGEDKEVIGSRTEKLWSDIGDMLGYAINNVNKRQSSESNQYWETKFKTDIEDIKKDDTQILPDAVVESGCDVEVEFIKPQNGEYQVTVTANSGKLKEFIKEVQSSPHPVDVEEFDQINDVAILNTGKSSFVGSLHRNCVDIKSIEASQNDLVVTAKIPVPLDISSVVRFIDEKYSYRFVSKSKERGEENELPGDILGKLTARQREVVELALNEGYFDSPRRASGKEISDKLDISPQAFHKHIRKFQDTVVRELFE